MIADRQSHRCPACCSAMRDIPDFTDDPRENWKLFWMFNFLNARQPGSDHQFRNYRDATARGLRQEWYALPNGEEFLAFRLPPQGTFTKPTMARDTYSISNPILLAPNLN